ncbi:MAG: hypothetical protein EOO11_08005 [Chitinophagaceae bacterium]|nr:MAG: hypothetical protein EOO11_08005 [Chitinophagaceae bacterium]
MHAPPGFLTDPYGLRVFGLEQHCPDGGAAGRYNEFRSVVERPAAIIRYQTPPLRYYLRSLGWDFALLLEAAPEGARWVVRACTVNPGDAYLQELIRGGELLSEGDYSL